MNPVIHNFGVEMLQVGLRIADLVNEQSLSQSEQKGLARNQSCVRIHQAFRLYPDGGLK